MAGDHSLSTLTFSSGSRRRRTSNDGPSARRSNSSHSSSAVVCANLSLPVRAWRRSGSPDRAAAPGWRHVRRTHGSQLLFQQRQGRGRVGGQGRKGTISSRRLPDGQVGPQRLNASLWPGRTQTQRSSQFHRRMVESLPPVATVLPMGENAIAQTRPRCPGTRVVIWRPVSPS